MGCFAALSAADGFRGDLDLLDRDWFETAQGIEIDRRAFTPGRTASVMPEISIKPYCSAKQVIGAITGFEELLGRGIDADQIDQVLVSVPENYAAMIDHGVIAGNRLSSVTSAPYQLALAAYRKDGLFDVARSEYAMTDAITGLMDKVSVAVDAELADYLPGNWPARIEVRAGGRTEATTIIDAPGDPGNPFDSARALEKFHQFLDPLIGDAAGAWAEPAIAAARDDAALAELQEKYLAIGNT
jgi:2-methylcitrate dehydratase PrpD